MAAVAPGSSMSSTRSRLFPRSRKAAATASDGSTTAYSDSVFASKDTNQSTSALSSFSTASKTSRFFRRFARSKPPPVPSLPPALVLDLDAGTAKPRINNAPLQTPTSKTSKNDGENKQTEAAAIIAESNAAYAAAETIPIPVGVQRSKMVDAIANARLNVAHTRDLVRMCGVHIRERGLDTPGLFRPFRISENPNHTFHLIQLFLLSIDVSTYIAVFPILPENALDRLDRKTTAAAGHDRKAKIAREELDEELRYAQPHDIVSFLKWGLRHVRLRPSDFHSKDADQWYTSFCTAERESEYHARAIADLLHPKLPQATAELLSETLDLMASVAAHSSSNHMPASTLCRVLGFWLLGKIGVAHPPPTYDQLVEAVDEAAAITEHLLLAHIRSQAAVTFSMPLRLMELVKGYPYIKPGSQTPSLPLAFASRSVPTLRIDLRSENLVVSQAKPRLPTAILRDALDASASEHLQGGKGDLWANILTQLERDDQTATDAGFKLLSDEHVRILKQVDKELNPEVRSESDAASGAKEEEKPTPVSPPADVRKTRRRSQSLSTLPRVPLAPLSEVTNGATTPRKSTSPSKPTVLSSPRRKPVPLLTTDADDSEEVENFADLRPSATDTSSSSATLQPSATWRSFSEEGFGAMSTASSSLSLSSFKLPPIPPPPGLPSRRSTRGIHRVKSLTGSTRRRPPPLPHPYPDLAVTDKGQGLGKIKTCTISKASMLDVDAALALVWEDQLLDPAACAKLPPMLFAQLNENVVRRLSAEVQGKRVAWLLVCETVIPPRPPTPKEMDQKATAPRGTDGADAASIFAPSMRTVRMRLRRVSTVIGSSFKRQDSSH